MTFSRSEKCKNYITILEIKTMGLYDIPAVVATALPYATTPANIMAGFRCPGAYPFNLHTVPFQEWAAEGPSAAAVCWGVSSVLLFTFTRRLEPEKPLPREERGGQQLY